MTLSLTSGQSTNCSASPERGYGTLVQPPAPFQALDLHGYDLAMVDPAWPTKMRSQKGEKKSAAGKYGLMSWEEIAALPVAPLFKKHGVLFLWTTWPLVLHGGDPARHYADHDPARSRVGECVKAWGDFRYVSGGAWFKRTKNSVAFGTGYRMRSACEPFLMFIKGNPDTPMGRRMRNVIESIVENSIDGLRREHSAKPEEAYAWCERYMPDARRVELFSRRSRPGWDTWGFEKGKFDPVVTHGAAA